LYDFLMFQLYLKFFSNNNKMLNLDFYMFHNWKLVIKIRKFENVNVYDT